MGAENSSAVPPRRDNIRADGPSVAELAEREGLTDVELLHRELESLKKMQETERRLRLENERKSLIKERRQHINRIKAIDDELEVLEPGWKDRAELKI